MSHIPDGLILLICASLGLIIGSFLNAVIHRLPRDIAVSSGRSRCPKCDAVISWYCNIPVLSWILLRGKCRSCKQSISVQYPLVEITNALLYIALWFKFGFGIEFLTFAIFCSALLAASVIDLHHQILPDEITLGGIPLGLLSAIITGYISWQSSVLGILFGGGALFLIAYLYSILADRDGLGGGDIKLLAMLGAWLGISSLLPIVIISSALGAAVGIILMITKGKTLQTAIPFGPFLAIGALTYLFLSQQIDLFFFPYQ